MWHRQLGVWFLSLSGQYSKFDGIKINALMMICTYTLKQQMPSIQAEVVDSLTNWKERRSLKDY